MFGFREQLLSDIENVNRTMSQGKSGQDYEVFEEGLETMKRAS